MQQLAQQTGGRFYEVSKHDSIVQIYASIGEELRTQYNLAYTPVKTEGGAEGYHKISLTAKKKDLNVQTRQGYYAER